MAAPAASRVPLAQQAIAVLWPSFVIAIAASGLFFSAFHPRDLIPYNLDLELKPVAVYSVGFFLFWMIAALSSYGTLYFTLTNRVSGERQPDQAGPPGS